MSKGSMSEKAWIKLGLAIPYSLLLVERQNCKEFLIEIYQSSCQNIYSCLPTSCKNLHFHYNFIVCFHDRSDITPSKQSKSNTFLYKYAIKPLMALLRKNCWLNIERKVKRCEHIMKRFGLNMNPRVGTIWSINRIFIPSRVGGLE